MEDALHLKKDLNLRKDRQQNKRIRPNRNGGLDGRF